MAVRQKPMAEVVAGDSFTFQGRNTKVTHVDKNICMNKVHINKSDCYEAFTLVMVTGNVLEEELASA